MAKRTAIEPGKGVRTVKLRPDATQMFDEIARRWGWQDSDLGSQLVRFMYGLEPDSQQMILGLPMTPEAREVALKKLVEFLKRKAGAA